MAEESRETVHGDRPGLKVVLCGPVGAGKTTFVRTLVREHALVTDEAASEAIGKPTTTVGLDFGVHDHAGCRVYLFGTPGQDRFDFVREILCEGSAGLLLLVSGLDPGQWVEARAILELLERRARVPFLVGVTHQDLGLAGTLDDVALALGLQVTDVLGVDATSHTSASAALSSLLALLHPADGAPPASTSEGINR